MWGWGKIFLLGVSGLGCALVRLRLCRWGWGSRVGVVWLQGWDCKALRPSSFWTLGVTHWGPCGCTCAPPGCHLGVFCANVWVFLGSWTSLWPGVGKPSQVVPLALPGALFVALKDEVGHDSATSFFGRTKCAPSSHHSVHFGPTWVPFGPVLNFLKRSER